MSIFVEHSYKTKYIEDGFAVNPSNFLAFIAKNMHNFDEDQIFEILFKMGAELNIACKDPYDHLSVLAILNFLKPHEKMFCYFIEEIKPFAHELLFDQYGLKIMSKILFEFPLYYTSFLFNFIMQNFYPLSVNKFSNNILLSLFSATNISMKKQLFFAYQINFKSLICDPNASYFVKSLIIQGNPDVNYLTANLILANFLELAQHKVASEVIEILIDFSQSFIKKMFIEYNLNNKAIETLLFDTSGNYGIFYFI